MNIIIDRLSRNKLDILIGSNYLSHNKVIKIDSEKKNSQYQIIYQ